MKYGRGVLTIEEVLNTEPEVWEAVMDIAAYDLDQGDFFFLISDPTKAHYIEKVELTPEGWQLSDSTGMKVNYDDVKVLFSVNSLIKITSFFNHFELRGIRNDWMVIYDNEEVFRSNEDEELVTFLWRVLKDLAVRKKLD